MWYYTKTEYITLKGQAKVLGVSGDKLGSEFTYFPLPLLQDRKE